MNNCTFKYSEEIVCVLQPSAGRGGLFISNVEAAENLSTLRKHEIYAVVTVARGYRLMHPERSLPRYLYLPAEDHQHFQISDYFENSNRFIRQNLKVTNVLVHCAAGISRSAALILAYLISTHNMTFMQALLVLKTCRPKVQPNRGFVKQLQEYQTKLTRPRSPDNKAGLYSKIERERSDSLESGIRVISPRAGQTCPGGFSQKNRPLKQNTWLTANTNLLTASSKTSTPKFCSDRHYIGLWQNPSLADRCVTNICRIDSNKKSEIRERQASSSSHRPQTAQLREITEHKYGSMKQQLDELKENIKELKQKFAKMKTDTINEFPMTGDSYKRTRYAHWR